MRKFAILFSMFCMCMLAFAFRTRPEAVVPFRIVGSYVVIPVSINGCQRLNFILDTGVRNTIITELLSGDSLNLKFDSRIQIQGLGGGKATSAFVSDSNSMGLSRKFKLSNKTIYVLENDVLNLSRQIGSKINGIVGMDFFEDYIVAIDYTRRQLRFYDTQSFIPPRGYAAMSMTVEKQKLYLYLSVLETQEERRTIKMFIDTGAELTAWFQTLTNEAVRIPEKSIKGRIGEGLSGELTGIFARVPQICIADFCVKNPIVVFPEPGAIAGVILNSDRDGTIGSQLLSRFNLIIDIHNEKFYFKPNGTFHKEFNYNIAGVEVIQTMLFVPQVEVLRVWKESPAEKAGLCEGDIISEINYEKIFGFTLQQVRAYFEKSSSKPMHLLILRDGHPFELIIDMKARI